MNLFRKSVYCNRVSAGLIALCFLHSSAFACQNNADIRSLAPRSEVKQVFPEFSEKYAEEDTDRYAMRPRRQTGVMHHVNFVSPKAFLFPRDVFGVEGFNVLDLTAEAVRGAHAQGKIAFGVEDIIINIWGSLAYFNVDGTTAWDEIDDIDVRIFIKTAPTEAAIRELSAALQDALLRLRIPFEMPLSLDEQCVQKKICFALKGKKTYLFEIYLREDTDMLLTGNYACKYDPWTYYHAFSPERGRDLDAIADKIFSGDLYANIFDDYTRWYEEVNETAQRGALDERLKALKRIARMLQVRGKQERAHDALRMYARFRAQAAQGTTPEELPLSLKKYLQLLAVTKESYERVRSDITRAVIFRILLHDPALGSSPHRARVFLARSIARNDPLRSDVMTLFKPLKDVSITQRLEILRRIEGAEYITRADFTRLLKISGVSENDVILDYIVRAGGAAGLRGIIRQITSETGMFPETVRNVIEGLARRQKLAIAGEKDEAEVMTIPRFADLLKHIIRDPASFRRRSEGYPAVVVSFMKLDGEKRARAQKYLADCLVTLGSDRDVCDFIVNNKYLADILRLAGGLPDTAAEQVFASLRRLDVLEVPDRLSAYLGAADIIQGCIKAGDFTRMDDACRLLVLVMQSKLETKYKTMLRIPHVMSQARQWGIDIGDVWADFLNGLSIDKELAAAFFVHVVETSGGNKKVVSIMRRIIRKIQGEDRGRLNQLFYAFQDSVPYFHSRPQIMFHFLRVVSGEESIDIRMLTKVFLAFVVVFEYGNHYRETMLLDFEQFTSVRALEKCYAVLFEYLKRIDASLPDKPPFGVMTVDFIDDLNKSAAYDDAHADIVLIAHPSVPFPEGMMADTLVRINVNAVPSARLIARNPEMRDIGKPGKKLHAERIIGRIACSFGLVKGMPVLYIGEVQGYGYWNLSDKMKKLVDGWHKDAVQRLEEMARAHGAKAVLVTYPEKVQEHYSLSDTNVGKFYKSLLKRGYRLTPRPVTMLLGLGKQTGRFYRKELYKTERPAVPDMPWLSDVAPFIRDIGDVRLTSDVVLKEKEALTPEMLIVNKAAEILFKLRTIRHDVGNIVMQTTAKIMNLGFRNKLKDMQGDSFAPEMRNNAKKTAELVDEFYKRGIELCNKMYLEHGALIAQSDGLMKFIAENEKFYPGKYRYDAGLGMLVTNGTVQDDEYAALLGLCAGPQERREIEQLYKVTRGPYDRVSAEDVLSKAGVQTDRMLGELSVMEDLLDSINAAFESIGVPFESLPVCRESLRKTRKDIEEFKGLVQHRPSAEVPEVIDIGMFLNEYLPNLKHFSGLKYADVSLEIAEGIPPMRVYKKDLESVLMNMARNAAEAMQMTMREKKFKIAVSADAGGTKAHIVLSDNGNGISERNLDKIFDLDFTAGKEGGTGLGLYVSKSLIEKMGGSLTVRSKVNRGTTFTITLPTERLPAGGQIGQKDILMQGVNLAALSTVGKFSDSGDPLLRFIADYEANNLFRRFMRHIDIDGEVIVGSPAAGERGMLAEGEKVGGGGIQVDIVPDIIQLIKGITKMNHGDTVSMMMCTEKGSVMKVPKTLYMQKLIVGKDGRDADIDVSRPIGENLARIAEALSSTKHIPVAVKDLRGAVLFRNRHKKLIRDIIRSGIRLHRAVDPDNEMDFNRFWIGVEEAIERDGICQSGNMTFLGDGDVMPVFGLRFDIIDFICGAGGAREGIMSAILTQIFSGKMSAQLCAHDFMQEGRSTVDLENDRFSYTADEKRSLAAAGFVDPATPDEEIPEGMYRWDHVFSAGTLVKGQDLAVFVAGIKDSRWIRGLEGIHIDRESGTLTVNSLKATRKGEIQIYETVYRTGADEIKRAITAETDPAVRAAQQYRYGVMLCMNGMYVEGIEEISQAAAMMPAGSPEKSLYAGAMHYFSALKTMVSGRGLERYADVLQSLSAALSADPLDRSSAAQLINRISQFYGHVLRATLKMYVPDADTYPKPFPGSIEPVPSTDQAA